MSPNTMMRKCTRLGAALLASSLPLTAYAQNLTETPGSLTSFAPCDALVLAGLQNHILTASSKEYEPRIQSWPFVNGRYHPWCLFQPQTTQDLSTGIIALKKSGNGAGDWHIAIRSGGHMYAGSNNIVNGVTIDLGKMNGSWYDSERKLASLEPGAHWADVYKNLLDKFNVTVTGGRDGDVGVGGFLLGGGISYYAGANGFGCDTIINYEVVLGNGTIVQANATENADLFKALKGGGSNFGIITRFDVEAMPAVDLAYSRYIIPGNYSDDMIDAVVDFTKEAENRGYDHLITLYEHIPKVEGTMIMSIRVNTKGDLNTTAFDKISKIPSKEQLGWGKMSLAASAANISQDEARTAGATLTFLASPSLLKQAATLHEDLVSRLTAKLGADSFISEMVLQPMPKLFSKISQRKGGNMLGMERIQSSAVMWTGGIGTLGDEATFATAEMEFSAMLTTLKESAIKEGALTDFIYINYAHPSQDALAGYGAENVAFMKRVAAQYDPEGFMQQRVPGGFKITRVE